VRRTSGLLSLVAVAALGCGSPRTEILLVVGSDMDVPGEIDHLRVRAEGAAADAGVDRTFDVASRSDGLLLSLALVADGGRARPLHVDVAGLEGDAVVVTRSATTSFVEGKVLVLHLDLQRSCATRGPCLGAHQTCVQGSCVTDEIDPSMLQPYVGPPEVGTPRRDGGADARTDTAGTDSDASDATDTGPAPLDDGAACGQNGACRSGHCVDGLCCEDTCEGSCHTCGATPGKCTPVSAGGADPRGVCVDEGAATCGTNGLCDGAGACQHHPASACAPPMLTLGATQSTELQGYSGAEATNLQDGCAPGAVVIGVNAGSDDGGGLDVVAQLQTKCGAPSVGTDGKITIAPSATLPLRGGISSPLHALDCPANDVLMGFDGHAGALLDQLSVRCAPLLLAGKAVTIGTPTDIGPEGGAGGTPFPRTDCPAGMVAVGTNTALRNWVSGFGLICAPVGVK
jgi:hypothetical protein